MPADVSVRGAGPVGCVLALLLRQDGRPVSLVEKRREAAAALRPIALSHASRLILERVGAWGSLSVTPITTIHISQQGAFGRTRLSAADAGVPALGYVADYGALLAALLARVHEQGIRLQPEADETSLVVHAEGSASDAQEKSYGQDAIVALVATRPGAAGTAWERFTPEGPLALLPLGARYCVVWSMRPERAAQLCEAPEAGFLEALAQAFGRRAGTFMSVEQRSRVPLALRLRASRVGDRAAFIGNAAQTLHPVAGQGLNLGLRDAWELAAELQRCRPEDVGTAGMLKRYAARRRLDRGGGIWFTHNLVRLFSSDLAPVRLARGLGLAALAAVPPAQDFLVRRMIFGARG